MGDGFWDGLGLTEGGLPKHLPMGMDERGMGPMGPGQPFQYACWCGDPTCPLTRALQDARKSGLRSIRIHVGESSTT